jgi:alpha-galactosidase
MRFDPQQVVLTGGGIRLGGVEPLIDGAPPVVVSRRVSADEISWTLGGDWTGARMAASIKAAGDGLELNVSLTGAPPDAEIDSLGLRFGAVTGVERYLRNGYQSWDGSYLATPGEAPSDPNPARSPALGFAFTALLPAEGDGCVILGFTRHDRFQNRFRYVGSAGRFSIDAETLWDRTSHAGRLSAEPLRLFASEEAEGGFRAWSRMVAEASPIPPRILDRRITGWCSWYSLYAAIDEATIREHLDAATTFRDRHDVPLEVFLIDDGFTPEMGDWLETKPQFANGMAPLVADIAAAGFMPGLWIAPFMVGNRSRLFREHPDWVVRERATGAPLAHMKFYGEFRWHKRSEEYYPLDITHPEAEAYIREVFRTWRAWGVGYFKTDFMLFGAEYGPDRAVWHEPGLSRIAIWRRMAELIREEIGDALWLGCGCPLWASVGLVDAMRIGRDIGVSWKGDYSAESLLRDQVTRNHASGVLWQADPDCILLRDRFHELSDEQVRSLALFAGLAGGVLMSSDKLDELSSERAELFATLLRERRLTSTFPNLATHHRDGVIVQQVRRPDGSGLVNQFNTRGAEASTAEGALPPYGSRLLTAPDDPFCKLGDGS